MCIYCFKYRGISESFLHIITYFHSTHPLERHNWLQPSRTWNRKRRHEFHGMITIPFPWIMLIMVADTTTVAPIVASRCMKLGHKSTAKDKPMICCCPVYGSTGFTAMSFFCFPPRMLSIDFIECVYPWCRRVGAMVRRKKGGAIAVAVAGIDENRLSVSNPRIICRRVEETFIPVIISHFLLLCEKQRQQIRTTREQEQRAVENEQLSPSSALGIKKWVHSNEM